MVALRKESVDRNQSAFALAHSGDRSLSARRAWIEIKLMYQGAAKVRGRSPQGERG